MQRLELHTRVLDTPHKHRAFAVAALIRIGVIATAGWWEIYINEILWGGVSEGLCGRGVKRRRVVEEG